MNSIFKFVTLTIIVSTARYYAVVGDLTNTIFWLVLLNIMAHIFISNR